MDLPGTPNTPSTTLPRKFAPAGPAGRGRARSARSVSHPQGPRQGRDGDGVQGGGPGPAANRRRESDVAGVREEGDLEGAISPRGTSGGPHRTRTRHRDPPRRRGPRRSLHRHDVPQGERSTTGSRRRAPSRCRRSFASAGRSLGDWPRRISRESFTATSSPRISGSIRRRRGASRSSTSASPVRKRKARASPGAASSSAPPRTCRRNRRPAKARRPQRRVQPGRRAISPVHRRSAFHGQERADRVLSLASPSTRSRSRRPSRIRRCRRLCRTSWRRCRKKPKDRPMPASSGPGS